MSKIFIQNPTGQNVGVQIVSNSDLQLINNGPDGAVVSEGNVVKICLSPDTENTDLPFNEGIINLDGEFVVQVNNEIIPYSFTANQLPHFFNGERPECRGILFDKRGDIYFKSSAGIISYQGNVGDTLTLDDGTVYTLEDTDINEFDIPAGNHKFDLIDSTTSTISLAGPALLEVLTLPTSNLVNHVKFRTNVGSPNLITVPDELPSNITNLSNMFEGAVKFNGDLTNWDVSKVTDMSNMFALASEFNQDLSQWCVPLITEQPTDFNFGSSLVSEYLPVWGTCPQGLMDIPLSYALIPWEFPVGILPKPALEDFWDPTANSGYGEASDGYDEIYYRLREPENVNEWTVEINDQVIGVTQTYNKSLPDDFEEVTLMSLLQKDTGLEYVYLNYGNVVGEEATRKDLFLDPAVTIPRLEGVIDEVLAEEIAEGRSRHDNGHVVTESLRAAILVNHTGEPIKLKLTPTRPEATLLPQWDWSFSTYYAEAERKYTHAFVNSLPALAERVHMEKGAAPTVDPITGAITIIIVPELTEET